MYPHRVWSLTGVPPPPTSWQESPIHWGDTAICSPPPPPGSLPRAPSLILQGFPTAAETELPDSSPWVCGDYFLTQQSEQLTIKVTIYCLNKINRIFKTRQILKIQDIWLPFLSCEKLSPFPMDTRIIILSRELFPVLLPFEETSQQLGLAWAGERHLVH